METQSQKTCTAFIGYRCISSGALITVVDYLKTSLSSEDLSTTLIFDDMSSETIEVDFRGELPDVLERIQNSDIHASSAESIQMDHQIPRGPGRPKLGVVSREVTLLPRHWEWLNSQPGGASVALRKLVEEARRVNRDRDRIRIAKESAYRFMSTIAGNLPGFEDAARWLFAGDLIRFSSSISEWPNDVRTHLKKVSNTAFEQDTSQKDHL